MTNVQNNQSGFTLIEILVAIAIFVTSLTAISAIFMYANKSQRATKVISEVQSDARFALEVMAQQVRKSSVYYASSQYGGTIGANPQEVLVLLDSNNNQAWFRRNVSSGRGIVQMSENGTEWFDLTPPGIKIDLLKFYISPSENPFSSNPSSNKQPLVTIVMASSSTDYAGENIIPAFLQTTVSSRQYLR